MINAPAHKVKDAENSHSNFSFENEIQKIKIHVTFLELVNNQG
jgi:hypothetical protein